MNNPVKHRKPFKSAIPISQQFGRTPPSDGTTELLRGGSIITLGGLIAIGMLMTIFGGVGVEGAHSNSGWLALIVGAMCLPFGLMLLLLGTAKWLRNRSLSAKREHEQKTRRDPGSGR